MSEDAPTGQDDLPHPPDDGALARVRLPARLLLMVSVLNLLIGLHFMVNSIFLKRGGDEVEAAAEKQWDAMSADQHDLLKEMMGVDSARDYRIVAANLGLGLGGPAALVAVVSLFGSYRMLHLHSYRLALSGAILTAIPCMTPCCLVGQIAGVWALVVLLNPDVRKAFH